MAVQHPTITLPTCSLTGRGNHWNHQHVGIPGVSRHTLTFSDLVVMISYTV